MWKLLKVVEEPRVFNASLPSIQKVYHLIDPFENIDPLINDNEAANEANQLQGICSLTANELLLGYSRNEESENDGDNSNWEWKRKRGAFNAFNNFLNELFVF